MLLGLVLGGIIDYFVPDGFIIRFLGRDSRFTLLNAVLAGFLLNNYAQRSRCLSRGDRLQRPVGGTHELR